MNDEEWRNLHENFETTLLLDAVGHVDELRGYLNDGEYGRPPEIRNDLLKLHGMAMYVVNNGQNIFAGRPISETTRASGCSVYSLLVFCDNKMRE